MNKYVEKVVFTDKDNQTKIVSFQNQIPFIGKLPPKFLFWEGKLWLHKGLGPYAMTSTHRYHEVESYLHITDTPEITDTRQRYSPNQL